MQIIYRLCGSKGKDRPDWFSKEKCLENFLQVFGNHRLGLPREDWHALHFVVDGPCSIVDAMPKVISDRLSDIDSPGRPVSFHHINERHNARACRRAFAYALSLHLRYDEILYFLEDDYLHVPGADMAIEEGIALGYDYVTCYDHPDKHMDPSPNPLVTGGGEVARVRCGPLTHWKETNSTTMTFAVKRGTLVKDWPIINAHLAGEYPWDFKMFQELNRARHRRIGSPMPGYSTHVEQKWLSPLVDWEGVACGG